jgi:hypothetical protein
MNTIVPQQFRAKVSNFLETGALEYQTDRVRIHPDQVASERGGADSMLDQWAAADNSAADLNPEKGILERDLPGTNIRMRVELSQQGETRSAYMCALDQKSGELFTSDLVYVQSNKQDSCIFVMGDRERAYTYSGNDGYFLTTA